MSQVSSFITPKLVHDAQFSLSSFVALMFLLFHYALIMRQLLRDPYMETKLILAHGSLFVLNLIATGYVVLYVIYPYVYREELLEEKKADKKSE
ncbi:hypothetical protein CLIB1423_19S01640 [[Candida] railenensis]|uniref:Uncharacterized protein n=1 Tax=[Candida] railenensis TaxID=45579 RepID=A0A9P0QUM7_9ASCO|nr:hypothetical protein CLIB1423_19S01640 [[Candida] railenensis]